MMIRVGLILFTLSALLKGWSSARGQEVNFCSFPVAKAILQAHATFNAVYEMDVDQHGIPINIRSVSKQFTKPEDVTTCLAQWKLPNAAMKHLVVVFEWQHEVGWTKLTISGPGVNITVRLSGVRCPYCSAPASEKVPLGSNSP